MKVSLSLSTLFASGCFSKRLAPIPDVFRREKNEEDTAGGIPAHPPLRRRAAFTWTLESDESGAIDDSDPDDLPEATTKVGNGRLEKFLAESGRPFSWPDRPQKPVGTINSKPHSNVDIGVLPDGESALIASLTAQCDAGFVQCIGGYNANDSSQSCEDACGGACCVGFQTCEGFTGAVCADNVSCFGQDACYFAHINTIVGGCSGDFSCYAAGFPGGPFTIEVIENSCLGQGACRDVARGGYIDSISGSCDGRYSCYVAAANGGSIPGISDSCNGVEACAFAASKYGYIGGLESACNNFQSCRNAAEDYGNITSGIQNCCNEPSECEYVNSTDYLPQECGTATPTTSPTKSPSNAPTAGPVSASTSGPSKSPTANPTSAPTSGPSKTPTASPTSSSAPTTSKAPSAIPSASSAPTTSESPSAIPSTSLAPTTTLSSKSGKGTKSTKASKSSKSMKSSKDEQV